MTTSRSDRVLLIVDTEPQGKARPRFDSRSRRTYTPAKTLAYEWEIRQAWKETHAGRPPMVGDVEVQIVARFRMPKTWSERKKKQTDGSPCRKKPDADNIAKAVLDALNEYAYADDAQVVGLKVSKRWATRSSVEILISEVLNE